MMADTLRSLRPTTALVAQCAIAHRVEKPTACPPARAPFTERPSSNSAKSLHRCSAGRAGARPSRETLLGLAIARRVEKPTACPPARAHLRKGRVPTRPWARIVPPQIKQKLDLPSDLAPSSATIPFRVLRLPAPAIGAHGFNTQCRLPAQLLLCQRRVCIATGDIAGAAGDQLVR